MQEKISKDKKISESNQYNIDYMILTSHRGDSGMKNKPGINIVHGKIPAMICTSFLNSIRACINAFHRLLTLCTTKAIKYFNRGKAFLSTSKGYK